MCRSAALLAVLLGCLAFPPSILAQPAPGYCRVYRTMSMGSNVACYYCLQCDKCDGPPTGCLGTWNDSTGSCTICGDHCTKITAPAPPGAPEAPAPKVAKEESKLKIKKFDSEPSVLYEPEVTTDVKKWYVSMDVDDGAGGTRKALLYVVTCKVKPKGQKPDGKPYDNGKLGFGHEIDATVEPHDSATDVKPAGEGQYIFKFKGHDCIGIVETP